MLRVWLTDPCADWDSRGSLVPAVACFNVEADVTSRQYAEFKLMLPLTGGPPLPLARGKKARDHGPATRAPGRVMVVSSAHDRRSMVLSANPPLT